MIFVNLSVELGGKLKKNRNLLFNVMILQQYYRPPSELEIDILFFILAFTLVSIIFQFKIL